MSVKLLRYTKMDLQDLKNVSFLFESDEMMKGLKFNLDNYEEYRKKGLYPRFEDFIIYKYTDSRYPYVPYFKLVNEKCYTFRRGAELEKLSFEEFMDKTGLYVGLKPSKNDRFNKPTYEMEMNNYHTINISNLLFLYAIIHYLNKYYEQNLLMYASERSPWFALKSEEHKKYCEQFGLDWDELQRNQDSKDMTRLYNYMKRQEHKKNKTIKLVHT